MEGVFADLHIHSRFSRACSKDLTIDNLEKWGRVKGLGLLGTGDFQHPEWRKEIDEKLREDEKGILWTKEGMAFVWQTEISLMYSQNGRRAVHLVVLCPNGKTADKITEYLKSKGRVDYDGRPIFGIPSEQFVHDLKSIDDKIEVIPAHCLLPSDKVICNPSVKKISDIDVGEKVLTHKGKYQKVKEVLVSHYTGNIFTITPYYFRDSPLNATENHPILAIKTMKNCSFVGGMCKPNSTAKGKHKCTKRHYESYKPKWIFAKDLEPGDVLLYPRINKIENIASIEISDLVCRGNYQLRGDSIVCNIGRQDKKISNLIKITPDFCRLIGYYLAEGYIVKKINCVQFSFAKNEDKYINDVIDLMQKCFNISLTKKRERNGGYNLHFHSKILTEFFDKNFYDNGMEKRSYSKKFPQWMLYLTKEKQAELFKGWWRGDAGVTNSETLANQMKLICLRLGIIPSIYKLTKEQHKKYNSKIGERKIIASHDIFFLQNLSFFEDYFSLLEDDSFSRFKTKLQKKHGWIDEDYIYIPIRKIDVKDYEGEVYNLEVENDESFVTPSATVHNCMTPFFGLFGSKSGFDSLKECFGNESGKIYAIESGMSADPKMLWRLKEEVNILSFSDSHSFWPWRLGREATIFELDELSYDNIIKAIRTGIGLRGTIETPPAYGRYHWDGHRNCNFSCSPAESKRLSRLCPICGKPLIIGVDYRVEELAKEKEGYKPEEAKMFYELVPLHELIALQLNAGVSSKKVWAVYDELIKQFGNEFNILIKASKEELARKDVDDKLIELILLNREQKLKIKPGYDGVYGEVLMPDKQAKLF